MKNGLASRAVFFGVAASPYNPGILLRDNSGVQRLLHVAHWRIFQEFDKMLPGRLRLILRKRHRRATRRWPNQYFNEHGLRSLSAAHTRFIQLSPAFQILGSWIRAWAAGLTNLVVQGRKPLVNKRRDRFGGRNLPGTVRTGPELVSRTSC